MKMNVVCRMGSLFSAYKSPWTSGFIYARLQLPKSFQRIGMHRSCKNKNTLERLLICQEIVYLLHTTATWKRMWSAACGSLVSKYIQPDFNATWYSGPSKHTTCDLAVLSIPSIPTINHEARSCFATSALFTVSDHSLATPSERALSGSI